MAYRDVTVPISPKNPTGCRHSAAIKPPRKAHASQMGPFRRVICLPNGRPAWKGRGSTSGRTVSGKLTIPSPFTPGSRWRATLQVLASNSRIGAQLALLRLQRSLAGSRPLFWAIFIAATRAKLMEMRR